MLTIFQVRQTFIMLTMTFFKPPLLLQSVKFFKDYSLWTERYKLYICKTIWHILHIPVQVGGKVKLYEIVVVIDSPRIFTKVKVEFLSSHFYLISVFGILWSDNLDKLQTNNRDASCSLPCYLPIQICMSNWTRMCHCVPIQNNLFKYKSFILV